MQAKRDEVDAHLEQKCAEQRLNDAAAREEIVNRHNERTVCVKMLHECLHQRERQQLLVKQGLLTDTQWKALQRRVQEKLNQQQQWLDDNSAVDGWAVDIVSDILPASTTASDVRLAPL